MTDASSPWWALTDGAWFACSDAQAAKDRQEELRNWPSCPAMDPEWERKVWAAMSPQTEVWNQLAVHCALSELKARRSPLDMGHAEGALPTWLVEIHADILADGVQHRKDEDVWHHWEGQLMQPVGVSTLRAKLLAEGSLPTVHDAPLPAALMARLRECLEFRSFVNAKGETLCHFNRNARRRTAELQAKVLRGMLRWADQDLKGPERTAVLAIGRAAAVWHWSGNPKRQAHWQSVRRNLQDAVVLADQLLARRGVTTPEQRTDAARWALHQAPWGEAVRLKAAETLAMAAGSAWSDGETLWAEAMAVLGQHPETHWHHVPHTGRHLVRQGISAATHHLQNPWEVCPAKTVSAMSQALPPRWVTELMAQVWLSARSVSPKVGAYWTEAACAWLTQAPSMDAAYWPEAVVSQCRQEDGPTVQLAVEAKRLWLEATLQTSAPAARRSRM